MHPRLLESADSPLSEVRLWTAQIAALSATDVRQLFTQLDAEERSRADRFHFEKDRHNYVASRGLLRSLLGTILNQEASKLVFRYGEHGKPALVSDQGKALTRFNVSHSDGWAMFAVTTGLEVGIDLESAHRLTRNTNDLCHLAERVLTTDELTIWKALPGPGRQLAAFLRAWTRKEAYGKATGRGLWNELTQIEVALDAADPQSSLIFQSTVPDGARSRWVLHDISAPEGFAAAVVVEQDPEMFT